MNLKQKELTLLVSIALALFLPSQQVKCQNIVTIFGQEKIEQTDEGDVFLHFREGLYLRTVLNSGILFNGQDIVAWLYATGQFTTPHAGDSLTFHYPNMTVANTGRAAQTAPPVWKWMEIKADANGNFWNQYMPSAYLYTAYESPAEQVVLLESSGNTRSYVNGLPHEGDHYDFGYSLIPVKLKKGINEFIYTPGRMGKVNSKLVKPNKPVLFTKRDMTLPDLIIGESEPGWGAIRVINTTEKALKGLTIRATLASGEKMEYRTDEVMPLSVRKVKFQLPATRGEEPGNIRVDLELIDRSGRIIDRTDFSIRQVAPDVHYERTFISNIDGSVQYYSVTPAIRNTPDEQKAMILTLHGAGVEARNQARAYKPKDWVDIVAATNRRPYGFNWEEWGRIDALEVLEEARKIYNPDVSRTYLTGHSMGGHGTWVLGTTYPDKFAAIAPCAGYGDMLSYGRRTDWMHDKHDSYQLFQRSGNGARILNMVNNLQQSGVYVFHGAADAVVRPEQARRMRELLGTFHTDFCYYEYPGGEHWFGDISVDWPPIFDYFSSRSIPEKKEVKEIDFITPAPSVSSSDYWIKVEQQKEPYAFSRIQAVRKGDHIQIDSIQNIALVAFDLPALSFDSTHVAIEIEGQRIVVPAGKQALLKYQNETWEPVESVNPKHKYAGRYAGFKTVYNNRVLFVYSTKGTPEENEWSQHKARFDAETFYYGANASIDVIPDTDYSLKKYAGRNVVIYGNQDTNRAWNLLLKDSPVQVNRHEIKAAGKTFQGEDLSTYFIYPHPDSDTALVGVVAGTGAPGIWSAFPNNYFSGSTGFPDLMIFRTDMLRNGLESVELAGFFENDWSLKSSEL